MKRSVLAVVVLLGSSTVVAQAIRVGDWSELPAAEPARRAALAERVVRELPAVWDETAGGWPPSPGLTPTFSHTAAALVAMWEAPDQLLAELAVDRAGWTAAAVELMAAAQVRDASDADPAAWPHSLYGSVVYPGWRPVAEWPRPRAAYEWDAAVPPLLAVLLARHRDQLGAATVARLEELLWYAADGALITWYQARFLAPPPPPLYWDATGDHLRSVATLVLAGELGRHDAARRAGSAALAAVLDELRRRGVGEFASPEAAAVQLDAAAWLVALAVDPEARRMSLDLWLYLWLDLTLSLAPGDAAGAALGGPSAWSFQPLEAAGGHRDHLYLAGLGDGLGPLAAAQGARASLDRRPPTALLALAAPEAPREAWACWGDGPGEDRSWWSEPGLTVGVSAAPTGPLDRVVAVDLAAPAARVHLSAERGDGSGGLPSGDGSGHLPLLVSAARSGRHVVVVTELYPPTPEERVIPVLFLPAEVDGAWLDGEALELPAVGDERRWGPPLGSWLLLAVGRWWLAVSCRDLAPDQLVLVAPAAPVGGVRTLQLSLQAVLPAQPITAAWALVLLPRDPLDADPAGVAAELAATRFDLRLGADGFRASLAEGVVAEPLAVTHDVVRHRVAERVPAPPRVCASGTPLLADGLVWVDGELTVTSGLGSLTIDLTPPPAPRRGGGRASTEE